MPKLLFIVSRHQPKLHQYVLRQFAAEPDMRVILDRRQAQRRGRGGPTPEGTERRQADRRRNHEVAHQLMTMGYSFARPMVEVE
jgi:hypothetical protein